MLVSYSTLYCFLAFVLLFEQDGLALEASLHLIGNLADLGLGAGSHVRAEGRRLVVEVESVRSGSRTSLSGEEPASNADWLNWHGRLQLLLPLPVCHDEWSGKVTCCESAL